MAKLSELRGKGFRAEASDIESAIASAQAQAKDFIAQNPDLEYLNETLSIVPKFMWLKYYVLLTIVYKQP